MFINNNSTYLTGCGGDTASETESSFCKNAYNSKIDNIYNQSTTGNISGVFDMSGGAYEYVMGYNTAASIVGGSSGITSLYNDFFVNDKMWGRYYDLYNSNTYTAYNNRILGDATGEMGSFNKIVEFYRNSWYDDYACFVYPNYPWFHRSGHYTNTSGAGVFYFNNGLTGNEESISTFRIILSPTD